MDPVTQTLGDDGVLLIALNRPDRRNAIDDAMTEALRAAFERAASDAAVRAVILTGEGKAFSAGGDLSRSSATGTRASSATTRTSSRS